MTGSSGPARLGAASEALAPVENLKRRKEISNGSAIALSGGGYRAMLFHLGFLWRLRDAGLLNTVERISSVSGGSITAGALALTWDELDWEDDGATFRSLVAAPIIALARTTLDIPAFFLGRLPGLSGQWVRGCYDEVIFHGATLAQLPDQPRFVFNATNLHTGKLFRLSKKRLADWTMGEWLNPTTLLSEAVAASSAFPPILSPVSVDVSKLEFRAFEEARYKPLKRVQLTDGGVYDNLGLETVWKNFQTLFVSDGGAGFAFDASPSRLLSFHALRVTSIMQDQIGSLRFRQMTSGFDAKPGTALHRNGILVGIGHPLVRNRPDRALPYDVDRAMELTRTPTRLKRLNQHTIFRLINWGYVAADDRLRTSNDFFCSVRFDCHPISGRVNMNEEQRARSEYRAKIFTGYGSLLITAAIGIATWSVNSASQARSAAESCRDKSVKLFDEAIAVLETLPTASPTRQADITARHGVALAFLSDSCRQGNVAVPKDLILVAERVKQFARTKGTVSSFDESIANVGFKPDAGLAPQSVSAAATSQPDLGTKPKILVYFQISDERQRDAAAALAKRLQGVSTANVDIAIASGIEVVSPVAVSTLRCLKVDDCQRAPDVLDAIMKAAPGLDIKTVDLSKRYNSEPGVKAGTYEIWLAPEFGS